MLYETASFEKQKNICKTIICFHMEKHGINSTETSIENIFKIPFFVLKVQVL